MFWGVKRGLEVDSEKKKKNLMNSHPKFEIFYFFILEEGEDIKEKKIVKYFSYYCLILLDV